MAPQGRFSIVSGLHAVHRYPIEPMKKLNPQRQQVRDIILTSGPKGEQSRPAAHDQKRNLARDGLRPTLLGDRRNGAWRSIYPLMSTGEPPE